MPVHTRISSTHPDRHALTVLAAGADAGIEREVVADPRDLLQSLGADADERGVLDRGRQLQCSMRYPSRTSNTKLPFEMSTWPPPKALQ